jgi:uncharacterized protein (TIGR02145 family)
MRKLVYSLALLTLISILFTSCEPEDYGDIEYDGVRYDTTTGFNYWKSKYFDTRDSNVYQFEMIAGRRWMNQNLRYNSSGSYVHPDHSSESYGRLYTWSVAKNACPKGWHLPTDGEWKSLEKNLGMASNEADYTGAWRGEIDSTGYKLKSTAGWDSQGNGSDSRAFEVRPAGYLSDRGNFSGYGNSAYFWTASDYEPWASGTRYPIYRSFYHEYYGVYRGYSSYSSVGYSCRCIEDQ